MTVQLLISTMDGAFFERGYQPPFDDYLVINQVNDPPSSPPPIGGGMGGGGSRPGKVFDYHETGLSKSRNRALQHATGDICVVGDDDVCHLPAAQEIIAGAFADHPRADIITFQARTPDGAPFKRYASRPRRHTRRSIMRVTSWEIALRTASVRAAGLRFDERFGLGADFPTGEENIFLMDALRRGLHLRYIPAPIAIHPAESSGADFSRPDSIAAKGAAFRRMFGAASPPLEMAFACKKHRLSGFSCRQFYRHMRRGRAAYDRHLKRP